MLCHLYIITLFEQPRIQLSTQERKMPETRNDQKKKEKRKIMWSECEDEVMVRCFEA